MTPVVRLRAVTCQFGATRAVDRVDLDVHPGDGMAIVGPKGAGRTTLLRLMGALLAPSNGSIEIGGVDAVKNPTAARACALYVAPTIVYGTGLSVAEYLHVLSISPRARRTRLATSAADVLARAGMPGDSDVDGLPVALRHRLALAALLIMRPALALLDDPLEETDPETRTCARDWVAELRRDGSAVISAVRAEDDAALVADVAMTMGGGRVSASMRMHDLGGPPLSGAPRAFAGAV